MKVNSEDGGEMAQLLRVCVALVEDSMPIPSSHIKWLTTTYNCSRESDTHLGAPNGHTHTHAQMSSHTHVEGEERYK